MVTNKYLPASGGLVRSVHLFTQAYRRLGHRVLVIAPEMPNRPREQDGVLRVPSFQLLSDREFAVHLPSPSLLHNAVEAFDPHVVHSHHPFLLGNTAVRIAAVRRLPLVFTHHTLYEKYADYIFAGRPRIKAFIVRLVSDYANLCQHVLAPSQSIADLLRSRGVVSDMSIIPTGIDCQAFGRGDGQAARRRLGIEPQAVVVGYVGRLAAEKNLRYLAQAVARWVRCEPRRAFLAVGGGPNAADIRDAFARSGLTGRLFMPGPLHGQDLIDAYHAIDLFSFASQSETQGLVLAEAMAAGRLVLALDGPGVREIVRHGQNGLLLDAATRAEDFGDALEKALAMSSSRRDELSRLAAATAVEFSIDRCTRRALDLYEELSHRAGRDQGDPSLWVRLQRRMEVEKRIWSRRFEAIHDAIHVNGESGRTQGP